jgi:hypothetical protein
MSYYSQNAKSTEQRKNPESCKSEVPSIYKPIRITTDLSAKTLKTRIQTDVF